MKMTKVNGFAAMLLASATFFGCASSNDSMDDTTASDVTMSETQTMGGNADDAEAVVVTKEVVAPIAVIPVAALSLENTEPIGDMFDNVKETENYSVLDLARQSPNLSSFVQLVEAAGLADDFKAGQKYTLFAPTNEAFSNLKKADLEMLLMPENKNKLAEILMVHILPNEVASSSFNESQRITLDNNRYIPISTLTGNKFAVGGANVIVPDVEASNGVIHVVDNVIIPSNDARKE
ncbi:fasciclin domain-containing protein [Pontibacter fetidus]|uniref:Fasciclin domain-containing protein n=1 Tax=Pontibacter fetidus TaxID=2700082 RepID=A0A6B2GZ34_9BACT|nr:fasciclin domain-containing protein [Pontibacter fetidus]NDK55078.1 fasciclin domain-containing protein [Pontibacter fetidus]